MELPPPLLHVHKTCFQFSFLLFLLECHAVFVLCECLFCHCFHIMCIQINPIMYVVYCDYSALYGHRDWLIKYLVRISCTWRSQYWYTSIVHNTGIKICSSIVYQYCTSIVI